MYVVVTSTKESKVSGVRMAFQEVFGMASVQGMVRISHRGVTQGTHPKPTPPCLVVDNRNTV